MTDTIQSTGVITSTTTDDTRKNNNKRKRNAGSENQTPTGLTGIITKDQFEELLKRIKEYLELTTTKDKPMELDRVGNTPTHIAAGSPAPKCLLLLIGNFPGSVHCQNLNGLSPLHLSVRHNQPACFKILMEHGAAVDKGNVDGITPFHLGAKYGRNDMITVMLGAKANCLELIDCWGQTALHYAIVQRHKHTIRHLIGLGASHIKDTLGSTPFLSAINSACSTDILEMILEPNKIRQNITEAEMKQITYDFVNTKLKNGKNFIHCCIESGRLENLKILEKWFFNTYPRHQTPDTSDMVIYNEQIKNQWLSLINEPDKLGFAPIVYTPPDHNLKAQIEEYLISQGSQKPLQQVLSMKNEKEMEDFLLCPICRQMMVSSLTLVCGHSFCRSCIHEWKTKSPSCPLCRQALRFVGGYLQNSKLQKNLENINQTNINNKNNNLINITGGSAPLPQLFSESLKSRIQEVRANPLERTFENVAHFGRALGTEIILDKNYTAVLAIDSEFPMHITYIPKKQKLCVYSPLLSKTSVDPLEFQNFLWKILRNFKLLFGNGICGIGWIKEKGLMIYHISLDMVLAEGDLLRRSSIPFVEIVKQWRRIATIMTGQRKSDFVEFLGGEEKETGVEDVKKIISEFEQHNPKLACDKPILLNSDFESNFNVLKNLQTILEEEKQHEEKEQLEKNNEKGLEGIKLNRINDKEVSIILELNRKSKRLTFEVIWKWLEDTNTWELSSLVKEGFTKSEMKIVEKMEHLFTSSAFGSRTGGGFFSVEKKEELNETQQGLVKKEKLYNLRLVSRWKPGRMMESNGEVKYLDNEFEKTVVGFAETVFDWSMHL